MGGSLNSEFSSIRRSWLKIVISLAAVASERLRFSGFFSLILFAIQIYLLTYLLTYLVGSGPLGSPLFTIISQAFWVVKCVTLRTSRNQLLCASWSSWLSFPARIWCSAGKQFNRCVEGVLYWRAFWQTEESQPFVTDDCTLSGRPVYSVTDKCVTKSDHRIPKMWRWYCMQKSL